MTTNKQYKNNVPDMKSADNSNKKEEDVIESDWKTVLLD